MAEKFEVHGVQWLMKKSPNIGDNTVRAVGLTSVEATCKVCGAAWRATDGGSSTERGKFESGVGVIGLNCRSCENRELISIREIAQKFPHRRA
jgi:hypothetical protein